MWDTTSMKRILSNPLPQGSYHIKILFLKLAFFDFAKAKLSIF
jgi:hypothetical protein